VRRTVTIAAIALALSSGACGGDRPEGATVDTALLGTPRDTTDSATAGGRDSLPADSARTDSSAVPEGPRLVLRADSALGDALYRGTGSCQSCHGARGEGVTGLGNEITDTAWLHGDGSPAFIQNVILTGIARPKTTLRGMPAYASRMSGGDAARIASYVYALANPGAVVDSLPSEAEPATDTTTPP
jgi:mono/diheme cytochrome c family protein